jgi:hypothetical protein
VQIFAYVTYTKICTVWFFCPLVMDLEKKSTACLFLFWTIFLNNELKNQQLVIIIFYNFRYNQLLLSGFFRNLRTTIPIRVHCFTFSHDNSFLHCNTSSIICNNMSFITLEMLLAINRIDQTSSWLLLQ